MSIQSNVERFCMFSITEVHIAICADRTCLSRVCLFCPVMSKRSDIVLDYEHPTFKPRTALAPECLCCKQTRAHCTM